MDYQISTIGLIAFKKHKKIICKSQNPCTAMITANSLYFEEIYFVFLGGGF